MNFLWFLFEPIAEFIIDCINDFAASFGEILVTLGGFIDEDKGGFFVHAHAVEKFALEAGLFDKPTGVDFVAVFAAVDWITLVFGSVGFFVGEIDVFEEGAGAGFFEWVGKFVGTDGADDLTDALGAKVGAIIGFDVSFDRIIEWSGHLSLLKF